MANKIRMTKLETNERVLNDTRETWEVWQAPKWVAKRAAELTGKPETWILDTSEDTLTFSYATSDEFSDKDFNRLVDDAWWMMEKALFGDIDRTRLEYSNA